MRALILISSLGIVAGACRANPPTSTGRLVRPSGLLFLDRPEESGNTREDLLITDSESEGVKILQFALDLNAGTTQLGFVPAPTVFFPLVVPAPGFPTEIAASHDQSTSIKRAYVLSPGDAKLHVLDVTPLGFQQSALAKPGNRLLRSIDLAEVAGNDLIPTDVEVAATIGDVDLVAVSFQSLESQGDELALFRLGIETDMLVGTASLADSPRRISVRGVGTPEVQILASSGSNSITQVALDPNAADPVVAVQTTDVGGPTDELVDAGDRGAFAIRSDTARIVHLIPGPRWLRRSTAPDHSPLTPLDQRGSSELIGTLDVHPSPIGAAAVGFVSEFLDFNPQATANVVTGIGDSRITRHAYGSPGGPLFPVLLLAHADGVLTFVVAETETASIATSVDTTVARVTTSTPMSIEAVDPDAGNASLGECNGLNMCSEDTTVATSTCPHGIVHAPIPSFAFYRAVYRGALVTSQSPVFKPVESSTAAAAYSIADSTVSSFVDRLIVPNVDRVLTQVVCTTADRTIALTATGTVTAVSPGEITVAYDPAFSLDDCASAAAIASRYEVYPGDEEMVLVNVTQERILEVIERVPVVSDANGMSALFTERLAMRITALSPFSCLEGPGHTACASSTDCGEGRACSEIPVTPGCSRACSEACDGMAATCIPQLVGRQCSTADFDVLPTLPFQLSAAQPNGTSSLPAAAPANAVFSTLQRAWTISYPGSRVLVQLQSGRTDTSPESDNAFRYIR